MPYTGQNLELPHVLFYSWTGWPKEGGSFPPTLPASLATDLTAAWNSDGLNVHSYEPAPNRIQITFAVRPDIAPVFCAARAKGRLQHALRKAGLPCEFSRKTSVRALGKNISSIVIQYVQEQLAHVDLADPKYRDLLARHAYEDAAVDLDQPSELSRSRYWYNLHLVFVTAARYRVGREAFLSRLRDSFLDAAKNQRCLVRALSIMPDHVHIAVRGDPERSPKEMGLALQNESARAAGCRFWQDAFYIGTFSVYNLDAIQD